MKNVGVVLVTLQLTLAITCLGQNVVNLRDLSGRKNPLRVSGTMSVNDDPSNRIRYSYQVDGSLINVSTKDIVLIVIHFTGQVGGAPALSLSYEKEYFFSSSILRRDAIEHFHLSPPGYGTPIVNGQPLHEGDEETGSAPAATVQVVFVQFVDGMTWGDPEFGRNSLTQREQTLRELARLEHLFVNEGERAMKEQLSKDDLLPCISSLVSSCRDRVDSCLADGIRSMIEAAQQHQHNMMAESSALVDELR